MNLTELTMKLLFLFAPGILGLMLFRKLTAKTSFTPFYFTINAFLIGVASYAIFYLFAANLYNIAKTHHKITPKLIAELKAKNYDEKQVKKIEKLKGQIYRNEQEFYYLLKSIVDKSSFDKMQEFLIPRAKTTEIDLIASLFDKSHYLNTFEILWTCLIAIILSFALAATHTHGLINFIGRKLGVTLKGGDNDVWETLFYVKAKNKKPTWVIIRDISNNMGYMGQIIMASDDQKTREIWIKDVTVFNNTTGQEYRELQEMYFNFSEEGLLLEFI
ncbi:membrane hypothetical protein [Candidatus Magnetomoraceae bacterium gMMP-15]